MFSSIYFCLFKALSNRSIILFVYTLGAITKEVYYNISSTTFYIILIYLYIYLFSPKLYSACLLGLYYIVYTTSI